MIPTDSELIARVLGADDRDAFGELVRRHQSPVRRFLRHLTGGNEAMADDLAQDTFLQAWRSLSRYRGDAGLPSWLMGIAHNRWRNAWRKARAETPLDDAGGVPDDGAPHIRASDLRQDLDAALGRLSSDEQTAVHLCYRQGLSHSETAAVLSWPIGTVKTHLARAKEKLRMQLSAWSPQT